MKAAVYQEFEGELEVRDVPDPVPPKGGAVLRVLIDREGSEKGGSGVTVADCQAVVTMRYHGGIAALLHSKPTVLLDYSPKMGGLADEGGGWAPTVGLGRMDDRALLERIRKRSI